MSLPCPACGHPAAKSFKPLTPPAGAGAGRGGDGRMGSRTGVPPSAPSHRHLQSRAPLPVPESFPSNHSRTGDTLCWHEWCTGITVARPRGKARGKSPRLLTHSCHWHCWGRGALTGDVEGWHHFRLGAGQRTAGSAPLNAGAAGMGRKGKEKSRNGQEQGWSWGWHSWSSAHQGPSRSTSQSIVPWVGLGSPRPPRPALVCETSSCN